MNILNNILMYLIKIIFDLYIIAIILRILIQFIKVDYHAPLKEFIFSLTDIPLKYMSMIIPKIGRFDTGAALFAILLKMIELFLIDIITGQLSHINDLILWTTTSLLTQILNLCFYLILFRIFISWLVPQQKTRVLNTLDKLTHPILQPLRRVIPTVAGFDLAPVIALILIQLLIIAIIGPLTHMGMQLLLGVS